jgi:hypothetical protein
MNNVDEITEKLVKNVEKAAFGLMCKDGKVPEWKARLIAERIGAAARGEALESVEKILITALPKEQARSIKSLGSSVEWNAGRMSGFNNYRSRLVENLREIGIEIPPTRPIKKKKS